MQQIQIYKHPACGYVVQQGRVQKRFAYYTSASYYAIKLINSYVEIKAKVNS